MVGCGRHSNILIILDVLRKNGGHLITKEVLRRLKRINEYNFYSLNYHLFIYSVEITGKYEVSNGKRALVMI